MRVCAQCDASIEGTHGGRLYCSRRCNKAAQRARRPDRYCTICGTVFKPLKPTSTTCSARCRNTETGRKSAAKIRAAQVDRGEGKTYRKLNGRHEHRVVAETTLGRPLGPGEVVHHINGDKRDNRPENLRVMTQGEHARLHFTRPPRECCEDGCDRHVRYWDRCGMHAQREAKRRKLEVAA